MGDEDEAKEPLATRRPLRWDLSWILVVGGIVMMFLAFLAAAYWQAGYAIYLLGAGILVLAGGFALGSRSS